MVGPPLFPRGCTFADLLPAGKSAEERADRLEAECVIIETLNNKRVLIKDAFRSYASSALTEITSLDKISLVEIRSFAKDMRCSTRVTVRLAQIFHTTLISATLQDGRVHREDDHHDESDFKDDDERELDLAKFIEFIIRVSREQIAGKDNVARKVQMMLNTMSRHCKSISGPIPQISAQTQISQVLKKRQNLLKRVYLKYCGEDNTDTKASAHNQTMNLKELFQLMKDCGQMDAKFSVSCSFRLLFPQILLAPPCPPSSSFSVSFTVTHKYKRLC
jgi:hypothetical protein